MKKIFIAFSMMGIICCSTVFSQTNTESEVIYCEQFAVTKPLSELLLDNPVNVKKLAREHKKEHLKEADKRAKYRDAQEFKFSVEKDGINYGNDSSLFQREIGSRPGPPQRVNVNGQFVNSAPHDPSGAVGTNYYLQAVNATPVRVINKSTGATVQTFTMGTLWPTATGNDGDPIVMYDRFADRWFLAQFKSTSPYKIYIAISATNNPLGSWYTYTFSSTVLPDYLKFSIWGDAYYMTSNQGSQKLWAFERTAMLAGSANARGISTSLAASGNGSFFCPLAGDADGTTIPTAGTPCPIFFYTDNGWGGSNTDAIKIFNATVNWTPTTPTLTVALNATLSTLAFDASYSSSWDDIAQPGTTQKLDGIGGVLTYRAQYRKWSTYNTVVLNWAVKVSTTQRSIMWAELRQDQTTGNWSIYQQSIYTPDNYYRWVGSIAMDDAGNIALCYAKSGSSTVYPSLAYVGRLANDPLNQMTIAETMATTGTISQPTSWYGGNRWGDYSQTSLDPDGYTFWHTGEWCGGSSNNPKKTQVYSFQFASSTVANVSATSNDSDNSICAGTSITFNATPTNGGTTPTYQWYVNGSAVSGATSSTYATTTLTNGSTVYCIMTSSDGTVGNNPATSNTITVTVTTPVAPGITISGDNTICSGISTTFSAAASNGGSAPTYQWQVNGANVGTNSSTYTSSSLTNGSAVTCILTSSSTCVTTSSANSNTLTMSVTSSPSAATVSYSGGVLTSSSSTGNQWYLNGTAISGATSQTYTPTQNGNYTVVVTSNGCPSAASNALTVTGLGIEELNVYQLSIYPNPSQGEFSVSFNASISEAYTIKVYDEVGKLIYNENVENQNGQYIKEVKLSEVASGIYNVTLSNGSNEVTRKVVVKK